MEFTKNLLVEKTRKVMSTNINDSTVTMVKPHAAK